MKKTLISLILLVVMLFSVTAQSATQDFKGTLNGYSIPGAWTHVSFDAANFSGYSSMTWTVEAADQISFRYMIIGKTMTIEFYLNTTTVGGTLNNTLRILIPASKTVASNYRSYSAISVTDAGAAAVWGVAEARSGLTYIYLNVNPAASNWSTATNNTTITGQITFEID